MSSKRIPAALKELATAQYISEYFSQHSLFPSNDEIAAHLKESFGEEAVGPLYPKQITSLKKAAYKLLSVEVSIPRNTSLELELVERLDLDGAIVVGKESSTHDADTLRKLVGFQAARFFDQNVKDGQSVTLSCSKTIREMVKAIRGNYCNLEVFSDCVVMVDRFHIVNPMAIVVLFLDRFPDCRGHAYVLPSKVAELADRNTIQEMLDKSLFERAFSSDWFFIGIGVLTGQLDTHGLTPGFDFLTHVVTGDADALRERGVVGEISYWPIDRNGDPVFRGEDETLEYFKRVFTYSKFYVLERSYRISHALKTRVVAAAAGIHKVEAIKAAAKYLDYLITDARTARALVES